MNSKNYKKLLIAAIFGAFKLSASVFSAEDVNFANVPLPALSGVDPNVIMILDDSGSMDAETLFPTDNGYLYPYREQVAGDNGLYKSAVSGNSNYSYLFPVQASMQNRWHGYRVYHEDHHVLPPYRKYAFARSPDFNALYYDPAITYKPWPSYGDLKIEYPPSGLNESYFDMARWPWSRTNPSVSMSLFEMQTHNVVKPGCTFWGCNTEDEAFHSWCSGRSCPKQVSWFPATYYLKVPNANISKNVNVFRYSYGKGRNKVTRDCTKGQSTARDYANLAADDTDFKGTNVDAVAYDGSCLMEVQITSGTRWSNAFPIGNRTLLEEAQNFANWFTYYRRRHQLLRGAMGEAFKSVDKVNLGVFSINDKPSSLKVSTFDDASKKSFLEENYSRINHGGTPLRSSLQFVGEQLSRTSNPIVTHSCQKSAAILFTDGYNTDPESNVGNTDGKLKPPFADNYDGTLADVAAKYYLDTLRVFKDDEGKPIKGLTDFLDPACGTEDQPLWMNCRDTVHMNTYTIGLNAKGKLFGQQNSAKTKTYNSVMDIYEEDEFPDWPDASNRGPEQIDDLYHAALNGRGEIFNADKASQLEQGINNALRLATEKNGAGTLGAFNFQTSQAEDYLFVANFRTGKWGGELNRYTLKENANKQKVVAPDSIIRATEQAILSQPQNRIIVTEQGESGKLVPFVYENLATFQKNDLKTNPNGTRDDENIAKQRLAYIRGDRSLESNRPGGKFRERNSALGDIIHSNPTFVSPPRFVWNNRRSLEAQKYRQFQVENATRKPIVYVGANDGMLHAFHAETMEEIFAFIPEGVYSTEKGEGLHYLTDPNYEHRYYVDMSPTAYDVFIDKDNSGTKSWRTILVGGYRLGGSGYFVLDITDHQKLIDPKPGQTGARLSLEEKYKLLNESLVWQFDDEALGMSLGKPVVSRLNSGEWVVIFNDGFNSGSDKKKGRLYIVGLDGGRKQRKVTVLETSANEPLSPVSVVDLDSDDKHERVYAGDMAGNLWAFNIEDKDPKNWAVRRVFTTQNNRPITSAPAVTYTSDRRSDGAYLLEMPVIMFGTGQYLNEADLESRAIESFYVINDQGKSDLTVDDLAQQRFDEGSDRDGWRNTSTVATPVSWFDDEWQPINYGWYINLFPGERVVSQPSIFESDFVFFDSIVPSDDPCSPGGDTWLTYFQISTGKGLNQLFVDWDRKGGLTSRDGVMNSRKQRNIIGMGTQVVGDTLYLGNNRTGIPDVFTLLPRAGSGGGRLGWEEIHSLR